MLLTEKYIRIFRIMRGSNKLKVKTYEAVLKRIQKAEDSHLNGNEDLKMVVEWENDKEDLDGTGRYYQSIGHLPDHSFKITIDRELDKTHIDVIKK